MARLKIANPREFEQFLTKEISKRVQKAVAGSEKFLMKQAELLRDKFDNSQEFRAVQTRLVGEFGFTPTEVRNLKQILKLLVPGSNKVTTLKVTTGSSQFSAILEWVDFDKLKAHPLAQHDLTRLDPVSGSLTLTETISWVDWLEDGRVVRGYTFNPIRSGNDPSSKFSRSGQGIMQLSRSGFWEFRPTKVFRNIGKSFSGSEFKRGFGVVIRRKLR